MFVSFVFGALIFGLLPSISARAVGTTQDRTNQCGDLGGYWVNQLNSEMFISVGANGALSGQYGTAVATSTGAAGKFIQ